MRGAPVDVTGLLVEERELLLQLLAGLKPDDWERPTECPAWTVQGIVLHLLATDLSLLSRQRDERPSPVDIAANAQGWDQLFVILDKFNDAWVEAAGFMSTPLLRRLLRLTGGWTANWYTTVDPDRLGEPVPWAGVQPASYRFLAAREYLERWIHHQQIRRAIDAEPLDDGHWVVPAVATALRGLPAGLAALPAAPSTTITVALNHDSAWTARRGDDGWDLLDGEPPAPTARLAMSTSDAAQVFSRALPASEIADRIRTQGDAALGSLVTAGLGAFFGRT